MGINLQVLLSGNSDLPKNIGGAEVRYFSGSDTYLSGAVRQVQIQFSKMGLNVPVSVVASKVERFENVSSKKCFTQTEFHWFQDEVKCILSVDESDDTFELTCWK